MLALAAFGGEDDGLSRLGSRDFRDRCPAVDVLLVGEAAPAEAESEAAELS